jgi:hypothetical protein
VVRSLKTKKERERRVLARRIESGGQECFTTLKPSSMFGADFQGPAGAVLLGRRQNLNRAANSTHHSHAWL